ncbi:MAG: hypothetical protein NVS4B7_15870 [Ktedonobacteraceae bacterium]
MKGRASDNAKNLKTHFSVVYQGATLERQQPWLKPFALQPVNAQKMKLSQAKNSSLRGSEIQQAAQIVGLQ